MKPDYICVQESQTFSCNKNNCFLHASRSALVFNKWPPLLFFFFFLPFPFRYFKHAENSRSWSAICRKIKSPWNLSRGLLGLFGFVAAPTMGVASPDGSMAAACCRLEARDGTVRRHWESDPRGKGGKKTSSNSTQAKLNLSYYIRRRFVDAELDSQLVVFKMLTPERNGASERNRVFLGTATFLCVYY